MQSSAFSLFSKKTLYVLLLLALALVALTVLQDFLRASLKNSAFYFSESFMFSSFWWLFVPLCMLQYTAIKKTSAKGVLFYVALMLLPALLHLFTFPLLVWVLSKTFYYHTYTYAQTLQYALSEKVYLLAMVYSIPLLAYQFFPRRAKQLVLEKEETAINKQFAENILVSEGNKKISIPVADIVCFAASPPYISIHLFEKKHLHHETLKSISQKLSPELFVRVHKSTIINISMVSCCSTRLNGDYDLMMKNNSVIRVSRNYAADFKILFGKTHQLATK
jgi:hypothetical protein